MMWLVLIVGAVLIGVFSARVFDAPLCYAFSFFAGAAWGYIVSTIAHA